MEAVAAPSDLEMKGENAGFFRKCLISCISVTCGFSAMAAVPAAWEQFPTKKNADSWLVYDWGAARYYLPAWDSTASQQHIWFYHDGDEALEFSADTVTAGGAFVGDFISANVDSITADLFIEDLDEFEKVDCGILTKGPDGVQRWYYSVPYTWADFSADGWQRLVRFGMEETWTHFDGPTPVTILADETFLKSVKGVSITFFPVEGSTMNLRVGLDNFVLEPKVVAPQLTTGKTATTFSIAFTPAPGLSADLRRMSVTAPFTWSDVPGQTFITGPAPHVFTTPLDAAKKFFRVEVFPDYFPVTSD